MLYFIHEAWAKNSNICLYVSLIDCYKYWFFLVDQLSLFVEMRWMMTRDWSHQLYWRQNWDKQLTRNIFSVDRVYVWSIGWVLLSQYNRDCSMTHQLIQSMIQSMIELMIQLIIQSMIQSMISLMRLTIRHYCQHDHRFNSTI
jgi:hypothetical protein